LASALPVPSRAARAGEHQVFDVGGQRGAHPERTVSVTLGRILDDRVGGIVDHVGVVARATGHGVRAGQPVQDVGAGIAGEAVGKNVARAVDGADTVSTRFSTFAASTFVTLALTVSVPSPAQFGHEVERVVSTT
jgi:hypothetical protein